MNLSKEDAALFYKLWLGLIGYVNERYQVAPDLGEPTSPAGVDVRKLYPVKEKLWENPEVIDAYISANEALTDEDREILTGWKEHHISERFLIMKHLKNYSVLMPFSDEKESRLYGIIGIISPLSECVPDALPCLASMVLLPFKGRIIYDSIIGSNNIHFGPGIRGDFNGTYKESKAKFGITTSLPVAVDTPAPKTAPKPKAKPGTAALKRLIRNEIIVDCYDEYEEFCGWHCYLSDNLAAPFKAVCIEKMMRSPFNEGEQVTVVSLTEIDECLGDMFATIRWKGREFAVPLAQLQAVAPTPETQKAMDAWAFWVKNGYTV